MTSFTHNSASRRTSEGTRSAQQINRAALTPDPYLLNTAPLRSIKPPRRREQACGFGACAVTPECTHRCRYQEADEALRSHYSTRHSQRAAMPAITPTSGPTSNPPPQRHLTWVLLLAWCLGCLGVAAWVSWPALRALLAY